MNQVQEDYLAKDPKMMAYLDKVKSLETNIKNFRIQQIPWEENKQVDILTNLASDFDFSKDRNILLEFLPRPSIDTAKANVFPATTQPIWMDDIAKYIKSEDLPPNKLQARQIRYRSAMLSLPRNSLQEILLKSFVKVSLTWRNRICVEKNPWGHLW